MDIFALSESLRGVGRILAVTSNYATTLKHVRRVDAMDVRVLVAPPQSGSVEFLLVVGALLQHPLLSEYSQTLFEILIQQVFAHFKKDTDAENGMKEVAMKAIEELGVTSRHGLDVHAQTTRTMIEQLRDPVRGTVKPIGRTCKTITIGPVGLNKARVVLDAEAQQVITEEEQVQVSDLQSYEVYLSEIDLETKGCRVSFDLASEGRIRGEIADPILDIAENPYTTAMNERKSLTVQAKAVVDNEGVIKRLIISDSKLTDNA